MATRLGRWGWRFLTGLFCGAVSLSALGAPMGASWFSYHGTPGSYIGLGRAKYEITDQGWSFFATRQLGGTHLHMSATATGPSEPLEDTFWFFDLRTRAGAPFVEGASYTDVLTYPLEPEGRHSMLLQGGGRRFARVTGEFRILELELTSETIVKRLAVEFTQFDNEDRTEFIQGAFYYNSTLVPEPGVGGAAVVTAVTALGRRRRARATSR
jgi:hypothetical protein